MKFLERVKKFQCPITGFINDKVKEREDKNMLVIVSMPYNGLH